MTDITGAVHVGGQRIPVAAALTLPPPAAVERLRIGVDWSTASPKEPNYYTNHTAARCYRLSHAADAVAAWGCQAIGLSDDPGISATDPVQATGVVRSWAEAFYYGGGSAARKNVRVELGRNEIDREYKTGTLPPGVIETHRQLKALCDTRNPDGSERYPNLFHALDVTFWGVKTQGAAARLAPLAPHIDVYAASLYNPEREASPVGWPAYSTFVDLMLDTADSYGAAWFSIWETGTPIDHSHPVTGAANYQGTTDWTKRPAWMAGLLRYTNAGIAARGMRPGIGCYWNRQTPATATEPAGPPNQWKHDRTRAPQDTATAWHDAYLIP